MLVLSGWALAASAAVGAAAVRVRAGIDPGTVAACEGAHFTFALWNTGTDSIRVRLAASVVYQDTTSLGPLAVRTRLGAFEVRNRNFDFIVPPLPAGEYVLILNAAGSDSTYDRAAVPFVVQASGCLESGAPPVPTMFLLEALVHGLGLEPDLATPARHETWGAIKRRYYTPPKP